MPAKDTFGSQPPLELIRQWIDYGFWYDRLKQTVKQIRNMFLLAAMGPPGGGRMVISRRLQSRFNLINMTFPQVKCVYFIQVQYAISWLLLRFFARWKVLYILSSNLLLFN